MPTHSQKGKENQFSFVDYSVFRYNIFYYFIQFPFRFILHFPHPSNAFGFSYSTQYSWSRFGIFTHLISFTHSMWLNFFFIIQIKLPDHFSIEHFRSLALSTSFNTEIDYKFMIIYLFTSNVANKCMHEWWNGYQMPIFQFASDSRI